MKPTATFLVFRDVPVGSKFRFLFNPYFDPHTSEDVFTKVTNRSFEDAKGRKFSTGATSAVSLEAA